MGVDLKKIAKVLYQNEENFTKNTMKTLPVLDKRWCYSANNTPQSEKKANFEDLFSFNGILERTHCCRMCKISLKESYLQISA